MPQDSGKYNLMSFRWTTLLISLLLLIPFRILAQQKASPDLINAPGVEFVKSQCTICHSSQLILAQRLSRRDWVTMIRWMQADQGLWPLGDLEEPIVMYLAKHYGPVISLNSRRKPLKESLIGN